MKLGPWLRTVTGFAGPKAAPSAPAAPPSPARSAAPASAPLAVLEPDLITPTLALGRNFQPDDLIGARFMAHAGRPRQLYDIYDETRRFGPGTQFSKMIRGVSSAKVTFRPPEELRDDRDAVAIAKETATNFRPFLRQMLATGAEKYPYGVIGMHFVYEARGSKGGREKLVLLDKIKARRLELDPTSQTWRYMPFANRLDSVPVAPFVESGNIVILESDRSSPLDQRGLFFEVLIVWALANLGLKWLARLASRYGIPPLVAQYDDKVDGQKEAALEAIQRMQSAGLMAVPKGMVVDVIDGLRNGSAEIHTTLMDLASVVYDQVFLGHGQASNVSGAIGGSQNSTDEAAAQALDLAQSRAEELAADFREQVITPYVRRGWGDDAPVPVMDVQVQQRIDREGVARTASILIGSGVGFGRIDEVGLLEACGLPLTEDDARALQRPAVPVAAPASKAKLAQVFPFKARASEEDLPDGLGEEIVAPYRKLVLGWVREGLTPTQALERLRHRMNDPENAPELRDRLAGDLLGGLMSGIVDVREARK